MILLELHCKPEPWSAARSGKHGFYDIKSKAKQYARWQIKSQYREEPIPGPVSIDFIFHIPIPKSTSKAKRTQMLRRKILPQSPDTTNLQKLYEDCLQGLVIENDRFSNRVCSIRYYSEKPGITIKVCTWDEFIEKECGNENLSRNSG